MTSRCRCSLPHTGPLLQAHPRAGAGCALGTCTPWRLPPCRKRGVSYKCRASHTAALQTDEAAIPSMHDLLRQPLGKAGVPDLRKVRFISFRGV